jgi:hypothetical protein
MSKTDNLNKLNYPIQMIQMLENNVETLVRINAHADRFTFNLGKNGSLLLQFG